MEAISPSTLVAHNIKHNIYQLTAEKKKKNYNSLTVEYNSIGSILMFTYLVLKRGVPEPEVVQKRPFIATVLLTYLAGAMCDPDDVVGACDGVLHVNHRLAVLRRTPVGACRQVLRPVHG